MVEEIIGWGRSSSGDSGGRGVDVVMMEVEAQMGDESGSNGGGRGDGDDRTDGGDGDGGDG